MRAYWDTSALAALYLPEANSAAATAMLRSHRAHVLFTELQELELTNAIQLRVFRKELDVAAGAADRAAVEEDRRLGIYLSTPLPPSAFATAIRLSVERTARNGACALDLLHVAAALELRADTFFTFDKRQRALAGAVGLSLA